MITGIYGKDSGKLSLTRMAEVLTFSTIFSTKETDDVWDFKEEDSHGDGGANV